MHRTNNKKIILGLFLLVFILCMVLLLVYFFIFRSPSHQAKKAVEQFYEYEQAGNFSYAWEMFHPIMKERFEKGQYLEDRPHVFFNHFGVNTFSFTVGDAELLRNWQMEEDSEPIDEVYRILVTQYFEGKYGNFEINQYVYVTKIDGEWAVLWNYKKSDTSK